MKKIILILTIFLGFINIQAQDIKLLKSTQQYWASGACCSSGIDYVITLESADTINFITIDTIWIGKQFYIESQPNNYTTYRALLNGKTRYHIQITVGINSSPQKFEEKDSVPKTNLTINTINPPNYKGEACVQYHTKNQKKIITVKKFVRMQKLAQP